MLGSNSAFKISDWQLTQSRAYFVPMSENNPGFVQVASRYVVNALFNPNIIIF